MNKILASFYSLTLVCTMVMPSSSSAQSKDEKKVLALLARPVEALMPLVKVQDDPMDTSIAISTYGVTAITSKGLLASTTTENSFMRAFINKKTRAVTTQVYQSITYGGQGFDTFARATYEGPSGIEEAVVSEVGTDVSCSRYGCTHHTDVVFPISIDVLRAAGNSFKPDSPISGLKYRIFGQSGRNVDDGLPGNEIVAFVKTIDAQVALLKRR